MKAGSDNERLVLRVILLEGAANLVVLGMKLVVGLATGSMAIFADALHSLTDVANNVLAWIVIRASHRPADREHPYGHRKFEVVAVFVLATLLAGIAFEVGLRAVTRGAGTITMSDWNLYVMIAVLIVNVVVSTWERRQALRLGSQILLADASHTFADVLITSVVIAGWLLSVAGHAWLDTVCALGVALTIMYLAFGLFRNVIPVLVDEIAIEPEALTEAIRRVAGVIDVPRVRSRWIGSERAVDVIVTVAPSLPTVASHEIADRVEELLEREFEVADISVHVEPHG